MINSLAIGARIRVSVTRQGLHLRSNTGTVTGFAGNGNVKYKNDKTGKILTCSAANCKVIKPAPSDDTEVGLHG
jgi:hypothetical protein